MIAVLDSGLQTDGEASEEPTVPGESRRPRHEALVDHLRLPSTWRLEPAAGERRVDEDIPDENEDGFLDRSAGHGTFISGIAARLCCSADVRTAAALSSFGDGDDETLAAALADIFAEGQPCVINMSFGGYTEHDEPPLAMASVIRRHARPDGHTVLVASAGNDASCRPSWPAALPDVIAVGALDPCGRPAWFTNHGHWVDACAPGVDVVSTFLHHDGIEIDGTTYERFEGWASWSGTSFAAPKVAAAIAREMVATGAEPAEAARRVVHAHGLYRLPGLGTVVNLV